MWVVNGSFARAAFWLFLECGSSPYLSTVVTPAYKLPDFYTCNGVIPQCAFPLSFWEDGSALGISRVCRALSPGDNDLCCCTYADSERGGRRADIRRERREM